MYESPFKIDEFDGDLEHALVDKTFMHRGGQSGSGVIMDPHPDGVTAGHATQVAIFASAEPRHHFGLIEGRAEGGRAVRITKLRYLLIQDITN